MPTPAPSPVLQPPSRSGLFGEFTDASCADGQYQVVLPDLEVDLSDEIDSVARNRPDTDGMVEFARSVLTQAYPYMARVSFDIASEACASRWVRNYGWENSLGLIVHECGHGADFSQRKYLLSEGYDLDMPSRDYFWRQEISGDQFHQQIPDAAANSTYFDVGATTAAQGIRTMYDEWTQYIHSVATDFMVYDDHSSARRDFYLEYMLNFAWAAQRYLLWAKDNHPNDFQHMLNDPDVREATLVLWGATFAHYDAYTELTSWTPTNNEERYIAAMREPALLSILNEVRSAHGCNGL